MSSPPIYIPPLDDTLREGTFVHLRLPNQKKNTTTIGRLQHSNDGCVVISIWQKLFPKKNTKCHTSIPKHQHSPIIQGFGSENEEIYQTKLVISDRDAMYNGTKILFPAFVFSLTELADPQNSWGQGLNNVYIARYRQSEVRGKDRLIEIPDEDLLCFPMKKLPNKGKKDLVVPPRCYHQNVWCGLFQLRKGIMKILNKRSGQSESTAIDTVSIGNIPLETFNYLHVVSNSGTESISCHMFPSTETYLDIDSKPTRRKIKMSFQSGVLRFESIRDLDLLRRLLGIGSVYGSTEHRPTLGDGKHGRQLKRGHFLTVVKGKDEQEQDPHEPVFKRRTLDQRVDLTFSPYSVKVTVGFERYRFDQDRKGNLKSTPPTSHLKSVLTCTPYKPDEECEDESSLSEESEQSSNESQDEERAKKGDDKSVSTFDRILNASLETTSSQDTNNSSDRKDDDDLSLHTHTSTVRFRFDTFDIYSGDQFHFDGTVYEIVCLFIPSSEVRFIIREKFSTELYSSSKPVTNDKVLKNKDLSRVGTIAPSEKPTYGCVAVAGHQFDRNLPKTEQLIVLFKHSDAIASAIADYN